MLSTRTVMSRGARRLAREARGVLPQRGSIALRWLLALVLLVPTVALQAATATSAGAIVKAGFEIDGNTPDDDPTPGSVDWDTPVGTTAADPVGNIDTTTFKGSKEFEHPDTWVRGTGLAPNQDDISRVWFHDDIVDDDIWGYVAFKRFTTSGTTNFDVEFNRLPNAAAQTYKPVRSYGDVMVRFEQDGNNAFKLTAGWFWTKVGTQAQTGWKAGCIQVPGYNPAAGWCPVSIGSVPFTGTTGDSGHFAEGAFNFSTLLEQQGGGSTTCAGGDFGTMNIRSFTGNANESALKDYVNPVTIDIDDTCGELEISKVDQFGNAVPGATFSISPNPIPGGVGTLTIIEGSKSTPAAATDDPDGTADGLISIDPATPGTYTVIETKAPAGYELVEPESERTWIVKVGEGGVGSENTPLQVKNRLYFQPPTISNAPSYDVDRNWQVSKSVKTAPSVNVPEGTKASFGYEVRLKALDPVPADYSDFRGTITVDNPNALDMVVTLSSKITGGAACTLDPAIDDADPDVMGLQVNVDNGANYFGYTCPAADPAGGTTATATWSSATYPSSNGAETYTRSAAASFVVDQTTDAMTTVKDVFNGDLAGTKTWGPFIWSEVRNSNVPAAHTIVVATYNRTDVPGVPGTCTDYPNVASENADGTTDTETVTVCVGKDLDVTKTANLGFERELLWSIAKGGPGTVWTGVNNGKLERMVRYTIDITAAGVKDKDWALTGIIKIDNPNDWPVTGTITDTVVVDGKTLACTVKSADVDLVASGHQVTVPKNTTDHELPYECNGVTQGAYVGKNTVTFDYSADSHEYPDADDTDSHEENVTVTGDPTPTNATVTITDLLDDKDVTASLPQKTFDWATVNAMADNTQRIDYDVLLGTTEDACTPHKNVVSINGLTYPGTSDDHTVTVCSPGLEKTVLAEYGRKQLWDLAKKVDKTEVEVAAGGLATFKYTVTATAGDIVEDGTSAWRGSVKVHNPSTETLTVTVKDLPAVAGWTCTFSNTGSDTISGMQILAGKTAEIDYICAGTGHPSGTNTAKVDFDTDQSVSETVPVVFGPRQQVQDTVVDVYDDKTNPQADPVKLGTADASVKKVWEFTYELTKSGVAGECTTYTNNAVVRLDASPDETASANAKVCVEKPLTADVSANGQYGVTYPWSIDKAVDKTSVEVDAATGEADFTYTVTVTAGKAQPAGWTMGGTIEVSNPNTYSDGAITLTGATVTTDLGGGASCTATLPDPAVVPQGTVGTPGKLSVPFNCTFSGEPTKLSGKVNAEVTWNAAGSGDPAKATDEGPATLTVGQETDKTVDVIDDKTVPGSPVFLEENLAWSDGLKKEYTYTLTHEGVAGTCVDRTNIAVVDLAQQVGDPSDSTTVTLCVEKPLDVAVAGSADLARAYAWSITKVADATERTVDSTGKAGFRYTVQVTAGASTDSGWRMSGTATVTNPNAYADGDIVADVTAGTDLGGGAVCTVTGGEDVMIGDGAQVTLPVACTFTSKPATSGGLTVTATWDPAGPATTAMDSATAPITFGVRSETDKVVDVVDDKTVAGQRVVLAEDLMWESGLVRTYTYDLALAGGAAGACSTYTNTARVDLSAGTDPSASATVKACTPALEVLPEQAFGKAVGTVKATCQGTVRSKMANRSGERVVYTLKVGKKAHKIAVASGASKKFVTKGAARARVVLKLDGSVLDRVRIPALCAPPEVLPETGLRDAVAARLASLAAWWR